MKNKQNCLKKRNTLKLLEKSPARLYCEWCTFALILLMLLMLCTHGDLWSHFFFLDYRDTGMDFFHSIEYVKNREPYRQLGTLYPPLANILFYILYRMIPLSVSCRWEDDFSASVNARGTDIDLRTFQAPMLLYLFFLGFIVLAFCWYIESLNIDISLSAKKWLSTCCVFSYGYMYSIERGNIIILVLLLSLVFVRFRNHKNAAVRELSYLALAFAAGIKLYPAFLGILLIRDKNWKAAARTIGYGILSLLLPFFFFKEGLGGFPIWFKVVLSFGGSSINYVSVNGTGFINVLAHVLKYLGHITISSSSILTKLNYLVAVLLLIGALLEKWEWRALLDIVLAIILYQDQGKYIYCFILIPFLAFLCEQTVQKVGLMKKTDQITFGGMVLLLAPLPYIYTSRFDIFNCVSQLVLIIFMLQKVTEIVFEKYMVDEYNERERT